MRPPLRVQLFALTTTLWTLLGICVQPCAAQPISKRELRVGGIFDLTGGGALWGKTERNAFLLACEEYEKANPGLAVLPTVEDSMFSSRQTVTALHKLISINKLSAIIGATWETTVPMMPICEAKKVVCISPSYHGKEYYERPWRYSFTAWFDDRGYSRALARQMNASGYKKVAIFAALTPYYDSLVENFASSSTSELVTTERMVLEERDFRTLITKVPRDIDAVLMLLDNAGQIQAFLKQWSELRADRPPIFSDDLIIYLDPPEDIQRYGFDFFYSYPLFDQRNSDDFIARYKIRYGTSPEGSSGSVTYDETMILLGCMKGSASTEEVRDCVAATTAYRGYSGTISFNGQQTVTGREMGLQKLERSQNPSTKSP